jgi:hypothetical protein
MMILAQLAVPAFFIRRAIARGELRTRFSLRFLFGLMTIVAVSLGIIHAISSPIKLSVLAVFWVCAGWVLTEIEDNTKPP